MIDTSDASEFRYPEPGIRDQDDAEFGITPSQTVGPYVHIGLTLEGSEKMAPEGASGAILVTFAIIDGDGAPISDAMVELWQTDQQGRYNSVLDPRVGDSATADGFRGLGRGMAGAEGTVTFTTVYPGALVAEGHDSEAPHLKVGVFARGMLERLYTRLYFPENPEANATDPVLALVDEGRRGLLIAEKIEGGSLTEYRMTIVMQHENPSHETPFFRV